MTNEQPESVLQYRTEQLEGLEGLSRAQRRGALLVGLGSDSGEENETRLSDVLADLMHWANHEHISFNAALAHAQRSRLDELEEWRALEVRITNTYEDGHESEVNVWVDSPGEDVDLEDWWEDEVFEHTGDGHGDENSKLGVYYEARIVSSHSADAELLGETNEWDG